MTQTGDRVRSVAKTPTTRQPAELPNTRRGVPPRALPRAGRRAGRAAGRVAAMTAALALSVQQPWAAAILWLGKDVENRAWQTRHRGRIGIHAGKTYDATADEFVSSKAPTLPSHLYEDRGLLGTVEIVGCHESQPGCCDSDWAVYGQWHWELKDPRPFPEPIPCNGRLGLWPVPDHVLAAAKAGAR